MKQNHLSKIQRIYLRMRTRTRNGNFTTRGPYYVGEYTENGKLVNVYIGKKLTPSLKRLLEGRYKPEGETRYRWPRSQGYRRPKQQRPES